MDTSKAKLVYAVGLAAFLLVTTRAWRYLPMPANWRRDPRGVRLFTCVLAALIVGVLSFYAGLTAIERQGKLTYGALGALVAAALVGFWAIPRFVDHAIHQRELSE